MNEFVKTPTERGQFGDTFGGFSALMSALGFVGLATTLWQQGRQMRAQQEQLEQERKTRRETDERQERQLAVMQDQLAMMTAYFKSIEDERRAERQRTQESRHPAFGFHRNSGADWDNRRCWLVTNYGGEVYDLRVKLESGRFIEIAEPKRLQAAGGGTTSLYVHVPNTEEMLVFSYVTVRGNVRAKMVYRMSLTDDAPVFTERIED